MSRRNVLVYILHDQSIVTPFGKKHVRTGSQKKKRDTTRKRPSHGTDDIVRVLRLAKIPGLSADPVMHAPCK